MTGNPSATEPVNQINPAGEKRPLLFALLCLFTWVYYGILSAVFLLGLFYSGWIHSVIHQYLRGQSWTRGELILLFAALFLTHALATFGVVLLWNRRASGYYLFAIPTILVTCFHLFRPEVSWMSTAVYTLLVILFGIFFRRILKSKMSDERICSSI